MQVSNWFTASKTPNRDHGIRNQEGFYKGYDFIEFNAFRTRIAS